MDRRDLILYWWPVIARACGLLLAAYDIAITPPPEAQTLAFAGTLIMVPYVVGAQERRNRKRELSETSVEAEVEDV